MTLSTKRYMLRTVLVAMVIVSSVLLTLQQTVSAWTMGEPMVFYWSAPAPSDGLFQQAVDGGYNMSWIPYGYDPVWQANRMNDFGLRAFVRNPLLLYDGNALDDPTQLAQLNALIDRMKTEPGTRNYAYYLGDEPSAAYFPYIGRLVAHIRERDPNHLAYVNLLPNYAGASVLGASNYSTYLSRYVSIAQPSLLSYDHYHLRTTSDASQYLQNLGAVATTAKGAGIPFVNIVQACAWNPATERVPTPNELRFLTSTTLAYGAQGIGYWNYYTNNANTGGLVYPNGTLATTPIYDALIPLNKEFKNVATQLQSLDWIGTYLRGYNSSHMPPGTTQLPMTGVPFNITIENTMSYSNGAPLKGVLFGFFDIDAGSTIGDATFAYIVNLDYTAAKTYALTGPGNLSIFDATTGVWSAMGTNMFYLTLGAGEGRLVGLTSLVPVPEPSVIALLITGSIALVTFAWRRRKRVMVLDS